MKATLLVILEKYLVFLAKILLVEYRPVIIGITGSVGKTTTKEAIYHILEKNDFSVVRTEANLNTPMGIALAILGYNHSPAIWEWPLAIIVATINWFLSYVSLRPLARYWVIEMGVDRLGDMRRLLEVVQPTIGILTWIGEGHHLETLVSPSNIAKEKGQLLVALPNDGLAVIPADDPEVKILEELANGKIIRFTGQGQETLSKIVEIVGRYLGLNEHQIVTALKSFQRPKGRLVKLAGLGGSVLIDDSYNSSLPAAKLALEVLKQSDGKRKIAIIGDILEQGQAEAQVHQTVADLARQCADLFIGVGSRMKAVEPDQWYASPDEAATAIPALIREGDVILVKGSQAMRLEKISRVLAADPAEAAGKLPRQSSRWQQIPFANP